MVIVHPEQIFSADFSDRVAVDDNYTHFFHLLYFIIK